MDPYATKLLSALRATYSLIQFMTNDFRWVVSEINQDAAKYFTGTGEYENAKTLLVAAYTAEVKPKFLKSLRQDKLYKIALDVAVCYQALKQSHVDEWKQKALNHLSIYERAQESIANQPRMSIPGTNTLYNTDQMIREAQRNLAWARSEKDSVPKVLEGIKSLK